MSSSNSDIALAIINFLKTSSTNGVVAEEFVESLDVAIDCIADAYGVNKDDDKTTIATKFHGKALPELINSVASESVPVNIPVEDTELKAKAEALKLEGNRAMARKDYTEAIAKYTDALKVIPGNSVYLSNRAAAYSSTKQHELAVKDAEESIQNDPTYAKAYSRLGLLKFALGDAKGAMEAYKAGMDAEGEKPTESMKKGYETAKSRVQESLENSLESTKESTTTRDLPSSTGAGAGANPGFPDLSSLGSMFGGGAGGAGGMADLFNNPQVMQAAQEMMSNPLALQGLMSNPAVQQMASQFGLGGNSLSTPNRDSESGSTSGGQPDLSELLNNPMLANLANQFMGGRNNGGSGN